MANRESEAFALRTYPLREADAVVSFFTRDRGKLRGIARGVARPKNRFGAALERLAQSKVFYVQKENRELVTLQRAELAGTTSLWKAEYPASLVLDTIAEAVDRLRPHGVPDDRYFRLLGVVTAEFQRGINSGDPGDPIPPWAQRVLLYFLTWSARLDGWLPPFDRCCESNEVLGPGAQAYFAANRDGLFAARFKGPDSWPFPLEARNLADKILTNRVDSPQLADWRPAAALALQRYLLHRTQAQLEGRLKTADGLMSLWRDDPFETAIQAIGSS